MRRIPPILVIPIGAAFTVNCTSAADWSPMYITKISHGKAVLLTKCRIFVFSLVGIGKKKVDPMRTQLFYFAHVSS